MGALLRNTTKQ